MPEKCRDPSDGTGRCIDIVQRNVPFGGRIKLNNARNLKPSEEFAPDVRTESVPTAQSEPVGCFAGMVRGLSEVSAELADILEKRAIRFDDVVPEALHRELFPEYDRATTDQRSSGCDDAAYAVVERKAVVHAVILLRIHQPGKPLAPLHYLIMPDHSCLRQSGGARGIDIKCWII